MISVSTCVSISYPCQSEAKQLHVPAYTAALSVRNTSWKQRHNRQRLSENLWQLSGVNWAEQPPVLIGPARRSKAGTTMQTTEKPPGCTFFRASRLRLEAGIIFRSVLLSYQSSLDQTEQSRTHGWHRPLNRKTTESDSQRQKTFAAVSLLP